MAGDEPRLEWGRLAAFDLVSAERMPADLVRAWQVAQESLGLVAQPIERFELAGTLNGHPGHVRSDEAKRLFAAIFALAVAGRTAAEPLRSESLRTAAAALLAWAKVYRPTGNPIDEWFFVPLLQAAALIAPGLDPVGRDSGTLTYLITARSGWVAKDRVDFGPVFDVKVDTVIPCH